MCRTQSFSLQHGNSLISMEACTFHYFRIVRLVEHVVPSPASKVAAHSIELSCSPAYSERMLNFCAIYTAAMNRLSGHSHPLILYCSLWRMQFGPMGYFPASPRVTTGQEFVAPPLYCQFCYLVPYSLFILICPLYQ